MQTSLFCNFQGNLRLRNIYWDIGVYVYWQIIKMIYLILFLGTVLRLFNLSQSLWLDEAIGAMVVKNMSFIDILTKFSIADNHPPLYYLLLKFWTNIFGYSEISLRMPSVLFGVGVVFLTYLIAKQFTVHSSLFTAILVSTSPFLIYYSQEARMYMMAGFFATLSVYAFLNKRFVLFSLAITILSFTDYVPVFLLPIFIIYSIYKNQDITKTLLAHIPLLIIGLFWLPLFLKQMEGGKQLLLTFPDWKTVAGGATFQQLTNLWSKFTLGRISLYNKWLYGLMVFITSVPFIYSLALSTKNKKNLIFWMWLIVPTLLCFIFSFWTPAFIYFRFVFVIPAFYILLSVKNKYIFYLLLIANIVGYSIYMFDAKQHREDWRGAVVYIENKINSDEIVLFSNPEPFAPYQFYETKPDLSFGAINRIPAEKSIVSNYVLNKSGVYYFEYLSKLQDKENYVVNDLMRLGYFEVDKKAFNGVGFVTYYKKINPYAYSN